jgi:DNA-directed RNA polymerase specialized sigma24 family protein
MSGEQRRRRRWGPAAEEDRAWAYLAHVPQDPEYPFHSLDWERWAGRREVALEEWSAVREDAPDLLALARNLAEAARLGERESAVFRRRVEGCSLRESARRLALRKATVAAIWREARAKLAETVEDAG